jgi:hypothetical protein
MADSLAWLRAFKQKSLYKQFKALKLCLEVLGNNVIDSITVKGKKK